MFTYAKMKHLDDHQFKILNEEIDEYHKKVGYFYDWSRQWEYPWILKNVLFHKTDEVLDVGGGTSHFPSIVAKRVKKVWVGDLYQERMFKTDEKNVHFLKVDINDFKSSKQYDIVMCISVLEHLDNYLNGIKNLINLVKKQGQLVITLDMFLDNTRKCKKEDIPEIIKILSEQFEIDYIDLSEDNLYEKTKLQEMKLDLPNLYSREYKNRTSLGIIAKKK